MKLHSLISCIVLSLLFIQIEPCFAAKDFKKIKAISKDDTDAFNHDINIPRTKFDEDIDEMILSRLGDKYRRANVYDFYPMEVSEAHGVKDQINLMDYYNYARQELEHISRSKLIRVIKKDLNLDGKNDYAVLVNNIKKNKNYLAIINFEETHYLEPFKEDFLELVNSGSFPTTIIVNDKKTKEISSPAIKLVSFEANESKVLYFDLDKEKWRDIEIEI